MKHIYKSFSIVSLALLVSACSSTPSVSPSKNEALNSISPTTQAKKDGAMQQSLDKWLQNDWTPTVEKDEKIKEINEDKERNFTLQEYVDKAVVYSNESNSSTKKSHAEEMKSLPAIGNVK